jgi:hypothetical protein
MIPLWNKKLQRHGSGKQLNDLEVRISKELLKGAQRKEAEMSAVQYSAIRIIKLSGEKTIADPQVTYVWNRNDGNSIRLQITIQASQYTQRILQVLQNVSIDNGIKGGLQLG